MAFGQESKVLTITRSRHLAHVWSGPNWMKDKKRSTLDVHSPLNLGILLMSQSKVTSLLVDRKIKQMYGHTIISIPILISLCLLYYTLPICAYIGECVVSSVPSGSQLKGKSKLCVVLYLHYLKKPSIEWQRDVVIIRIIIIFLIINGTFESISFYEEKKRRRTPVVLKIGVNRVSVSRTCLVMS